MKLESELFSDLVRRIDILTELNTLQENLIKSLDQDKARLIRKVAELKRELRG